MGTYRRGDGPIVLRKQPLEHDPDTFTNERTNERDNAASSDSRLKTQNETARGSGTVPSNTPSKTPQPMALPTMLRTPPRAANAPPVMKPDMMAFHGSSFCRYLIRNKWVRSLTMLKKDWLLLKGCFFFFFFFF
jgi:hypothetical protein